MVREDLIKACFSRMQGEPTYVLVSRDDSFLPGTSRVSRFMPYTVRDDYALTRWHMHTNNRISGHPRRSPWPLPYRVRRSNTTASSRGRLPKSCKLIIGAMQCYHGFVCSREPGSYRSAAYHSSTFGNPMQTAPGPLD
jgi:hypothetical protein